MTLHRIAIYFLFLLSSLTLLSANADKEIITGSFSTPDRAQLQNMKTEAYLGNYPSIAPLMKAKRFYFDVKYFNHNYRAVLTQFKNSDELLSVLNVVKRIYPDAYASALTPSLLPPETQKNQPSVQTAGSTNAKEEFTAVQPSKLPQPEHAKPIANPVQKRSAEVENSRAVPPVAEKSVIQNETVDTAASDADIIVIDETNAPEQIKENAVQADTVLPSPEETVQKSEPPAAPAAKTEAPPYLILSIVAAAVILIILFFISRRRKNISSVINRPQDIDLSALTAVDNGDKDVVKESESISLEPETAQEHPPAMEYPESNTVQTPSGPEILPTEEETEHLATPRKRRDAPLHTAPVTKDDLSDFAGSKILVAEDNMINQKVISKLFEGSGIEIIIANNGQEAVDMLNNDPSFNMVLMDAHMPIKDGFEATREIRKNILFEPITVVALSGDVGSDDIRKMKEAGMEEQLSKPLRVEALYDVLYQYLELTSDTDEPDNVTDSQLDEERFGDDALNKAEGLEICGGDKEMYGEILDDFIRSYATSDRLVNTYIESNDDIKLVALMLDIKGVAANIGADPLSESAETLREAVLINQTEAYAMLANEYSRELHRLLEAIESFKKSINNR